MTTQGAATPIYIYTHCTRGRDRDQIAINGSRIVVNVSQEIKTVSGLLYNNQDQQDIYQ